MSIIIGNNNPNTLSGTNSTDIILGKNGNDTIIGNAGSDFIDGGNGNDTIDGGAGNDVIDGGNGDDTLNGGTGNDRIFGGNGNDTISGGSGNDCIDGGNGNDTLNGGAGSDDIYAGKGDDLIIHDATESNSGDYDFYDGEQGRDTLRLIVSQATYNSSAFQAELARYQSAIAKKGIASGTFDTLNVQFVSIERIEVVIKAPSNQAPTMSAGVAAANEDGPAVNVNLATLGNDADSDDDGASLTYAIVGAPSAGSASISGTTLTFNPGSAFQDLAAGQPRNVVIQVQATDRHGAVSNTANVTVTVTGSNDAPTMSASVAAANEDGPAVNVNLAALGNDADSDDDGASLTYAIVGAPSAGSASISGTTLTFNPGSAFQDLAAGQPRNVVIQVQAMDRHGAVSNTANVTVTVTGTNDAPTMSVGFAAANEDGSAVDVNLAALGNDADSDDDGASLTYAIVGAPSEGSASISGTTLTFNPGSAFQDLAAGQTRDVVIQVQATDRHNALSNTENVTVTVTGANDAPTNITLDQSSLREDSRGFVVGTLSTEDADQGDTFTYTVDDPRFEVVDGNILKLIDTQKVDYESETEITIKITAVDSSGAPVQTSFLLSVENGFEATAIDGYVAGATVFADADGDGVLDSGEAWSTTDAFGQFTLFGGSGPLVMFGGTDISTGKPFLGTMRAPEGSTVVTPLTTLVAAIVDSGATIEAANNLVLVGLGLELPPGADLTSFDPIAATVAGDELGSATIAAAIQVQNTIVQAAAVLEGAGGDFTSASVAIASALAAQISSATQPVSLADSAIISSVLLDPSVTSAVSAASPNFVPALVSNVAESVVEVITTSNALTKSFLEPLDQEASPLSGVELLEALARVSSVAQVATTSLATATSTGDTSSVQNFTGGNLIAAVEIATAFNVTGTGGGVDLTGTSGADTLSGSGGTDVLLGLAGNDFLQGLAGNDILDGGAGIDTAVYTDATGGITVALAAGTVTSTAGGDAAGIGTDTLISVENVTGSNFADSYNATGFSGASANAGSTGALNGFEGMGGNDTITGNGSTIVLYTNATAGVTVDIAAGTATSTAGGDAAGIGNDTFSGVSGITASAFDDTLRGSNTTATVELFIGGAGNDLIDGRGGLDRANYASILDDTTTGGVSIDMASGIVTGDASVGTDTLRSIEMVRGSRFDDTYVATGFSNTSANAGSNGTFNEFEGMGGNDTITGNGNTRIAFFNATGGVTVDLAAGTASGNTSVGTDTITGGVNSIAGSNFSDTLYGSNNAPGTNEQFDGRAGNDTFDGRGGFDIAVYNNDPTVNAGIVVDMAAGTVTSTSAAIGTDSLQGIEGIRGTNFADSYDATGFDGFSTNAGSLGNFNEFDGQGGNDIITGNGNTQIVYGSATAGVTVNLASGIATGNASVGTDTILGGVSRVLGSGFNDTLIGNEFNNVLNGQGGNDTIDGGAGNDTLTGGGGTDTFVFEDGFGVDTITDFNQAQADKIDLTGVTSVTDFATLQTLATQSGANTVIDFGGGNVLTLNNVTLANLTANDFLIS